MQNATGRLLFLVLLFLIATDFALDGIGGRLDCVTDGTKEELLLK